VTAAPLRRPIRRIVFVYPPYGPVKNEPGLRAVKENYGVFPSLSLAYVAAVAEKEGCDVKFIDANALGLSLAETIRRAEAFAPDLLAFTVTTYLFHQTLAWVRALRRKIGAPTLLGGVHLGLFPAETMTHDCVDFACQGEAEVELPAFLRAMNDGGELAAVPGLVWRDGARVAINDCSAPLADVDRAPFPARNLLPNDRYYSFISRFRNFTPLITSRGCPFHCVFCEQGGKPFRPRSPMNVVDEVEECCDVYKIREFDFFDSSFTTNKRRVIEICQELVRRRVRAVWAIRSRVDLVDDEMLIALRGAGCKRIYYGIESGDEAVLRGLRKETSLPLVREVVAKTRRRGIETFGYFLVGSPGETRETVKKSVDLALGLKLDYVQFSKVTLMPGTELYRLMLAEQHRDFWREHIVNEAVDFYLPRPGTALTEAEVQALVRHAYLAFYFRPRYILKALFRVRSWAELRRSALTAWTMFSQRREVFDAAWTEKVQY
jgi:radical SAM superfamily enzyme YgiQ (UPF0313 family)